MQSSTTTAVIGAAIGRHLRRLATALRDRRETTTRSLAERCPHLTVRAARPGGYHVWTSLPDAVRDDEAVAAALRHAVSVSPGSAYYLPGGPNRHLRLSYVAAASPEEIVRGVERLDQALRQLL
ncbi:hypothetical protein EV652_103167 [Kribbella steppae]|uniref:Aminotransferase class I/classII large domain-containing protein n=2 Tax=Kribbella steppae TaxID=2512223 RepID=A0A4R2HRP7_9ACTN|nr:hypothetical protein EV652_103167 [Kribbella steppae]